ncbi:MAG: RluA family pseudouridine synthase [Flavobacteriales bacterium]|nr:MAG: RluA family pseudouridine synthase [Flavobacteriales bacterium]
MSSTEKPLEVLWRDDHVAAVLKPAGVPSQPDKTGDTSVLELVGKVPGFASQPQEIGLPHRLDRPVSGVMLLALTPQALTGLSGAFASGSVRKEYWAVVHGVPPERGEWLHRFKQDAVKHKAVPCAPSAGREVRVLYRKLAQGDRYALLALQPLGGMFHQLRAQCSAAGFPIKGDVKYGARRGEPDRSIGLHARSLSFEHPVSGKVISVEAPAPATALWKALLDVAGSDVPER